ncbi:hypothetical protein DFH06DRAFT_1147142 [Mycena polygramma]|nr:hypothetical protein DFH06DRAFT_1147142 [Mycena polygramma]
MAEEDMLLVVEIEPTTLPCSSLRYCAGRKGSTMIYKGLLCWKGNHVWVLAQMYIGQLYEILNESNLGAACITERKQAMVFGCFQGLREKGSTFNYDPQSPQRHANSRICLKCQCCASRTEVKLQRRQKWKVVFDGKAKAENRSASSLHAVGGNQTPASFLQRCRTIDYNQCKVTPVVNDGMGCLKGVATDTLRRLPTQM